jgi:HNH endonuclease
LKNEIEPELLRTLLRYDADSGKLYWLPRDIEHFPNRRAANVWNGRYANKEALTYRLRGYCYGRLFDKSVSAHRVAYAIFHGVWPDHVDHINGDRADNRIENLRSVTRTENNRNCRISKSNKSGFTGVFFASERMRWLAYIGVAGKRIDLGAFTTQSDAVAARKSAEQRFGYHPNHGRRA